ncbi:M13-type metalloendopeptidase [Fructobacillus ficulneus]|uniref:Peptidase family M13 n=1 Tax=Fructobacillus ficulneus TaxID=157463 RepID=A0A0K8MFZ0_9LACO|nr:M13-type metalloendopeptidase [Fructobacillus ficulneus]GAO99407.1 peptidase family M13 [Fructobacillus ficulneus]
MTKNYRDDFYQAVNGDWISQAKIPADKPVTGGFYDLADQIEDLERKVLAQVEAGEEDVPALKEFVALHQLTKDWSKRGEDESGQVQKFLAPLLKIKTWSDFQKAEGQLILDSYTTPLAPTISPDSKNTDRNELWLADPSLILPDVTSYQDSATKESLLGAWSEMATGLLKKFGFDDQETQDLVEKTLAFDQLLADTESSRETLSDYWRNYHPMSLADLAEKTPDYQINTVLQELVGSDLDKVIVYDGQFFENAHKVYQEENFDMILAWSVVKNALEVAPFLGDETRVAAGAYGRKLSGASEAVKADKSAFRQARAFFAQVVGRWYGQTYFGADAKKDVEQMVQDLIDVYDGRFDDQKWLSAETRKEAKVKLRALQVKVGYPEVIPAYLADRKVDPALSLLDNIQVFSKAAVKDTFSHWGQTPDRDKWEMPGDLVNAYYSPEFNQIVFPSAILQAPFYDYHQTASQNFGGIGTVIAHEITHAFDTNGARYDEKGNLKEWWTKQDFANFEKKTQAVIDRFEGQDSAGSKINGHLTVSENVADLGGVSAALAAAKAQPDFSAKEFFENFATLWRQKAKDEYLAMLAKIDVHAPGKLRTNVILPNFDDFHETYQTQAGDGMWVAPAERIKIW